MKNLVCSTIVMLALAALLVACGGGGGGGNYDGDSGTTTDPNSCETSTSFEFSATAPFCIGTSPLTATFSSGVSKSVGQADLYQTGSFSWHVLSGTSATVTFETLPSTLTFFVRTEFAGTVSDIQILDENGDLILSVTPTTMFVQVVVNRDPGQTIIGSVVVTSTSGGDVVIDDFVFL